MRQIQVAKGVISVPEIALGCMRIADMEIKDVQKLVDACLDVGINFFDHADIYGRGGSEEVFAQALDMNSELREKLILQSKCGIRPDKGMFDFSKDHIIASVDGILKRLRTEYLDILLLHRPDTLVVPEEVADAFNQLFNSGKVRHFGVSNQNPYQIELLKKYVEQPLLFNQLQLSITNTGMIDQGFNVNMTNSRSVDHDGGILDYCRLKDITIQAWSPYQYGFFEGVFLDNPKFPILNDKIDEIAKRYDVTNTAIATAWISRHPAKIQTIVGTTSPYRIKEVAKASQIQLTREEWYGIYRAAGNQLP